MKNKYNKKQINAIDSLKYNIDELSNKPRRLFNSLIKFTDAFVDDKKYKAEVIDTIYDFERRYYMFYTLSEISSDLLEKSNKTIKELTGEVAFNKTSYIKDLKKRRDDFSNYENGVKDACKMLSKEMINKIIEHIN